MGHEQADINKHHQKLALQEAIRQEQRMLEAKQKLGNKLATGQHKPTPAIACKVVKTAQGLVTDPKQVLEAMHEWCRAKLVAPEPGGKTGRYLPEEAQRNYPFDDRTDPDFRQYKDLLLRTAPNGPREWMHRLICDEVAFHTCLKTLKHNKAPGPDGVINEINLQVE